MGELKKPVSSTAGGAAATAAIELVGRWGAESTQDARALQLPGAKNSRGFHVDPLSLNFSPQALDAGCKAISFHVSLSVPPALPVRWGSSCSCTV